MKSQPENAPGQVPTWFTWLSCIVYRMYCTAAVDPAASAGELKCPRSAGVNVPLAAGVNVTPSVDVSTVNGPVDALPPSPQVAVGSMAIWLMSIGRQESWLFWEKAERKSAS